MTELKTLKDFDLISEKIWDSKGKYPMKGFVAIDELKAEAVKWVKEMRKDYLEHHIKTQGVWAFTEFFNLEEDLK